MISRQQLVGWVLFLVGFVSLAGSWFVSGVVAAATAVVTIVLVAVGVVLIGTAPEAGQATHG